MKKFKFNLESLLTIREWEEQKARQALSQANAVLAVVERRIDDLRRRQEAVAAEWLELSTAGSFSPNVRISADAGISQVAQELTETEKRRQLAIETREKAMAYLAETSRAKKVVENLKEKKFEEYEAERLRAEAAEIDDIFNSRRRGM